MVDATPNQALLHLLHNQRWPSRLSDPIRHLVDRLQNDRGDPAAWRVVLEELISLLLNFFGGAESDLKETEGFLTSLDRRLKEIDGIIRHIQTIREDAAASGKNLRTRLDAEVVGVRRGADDAVNLESFKEMVRQRLDSIQQQIERHLREDDDRLRLAKRNMERVRSQMRYLEDEELRLRGKLAEALILATTDKVTGLANRTAYDQRIEEEFARWKRFRRPLSLVVWDIDDFKRINDIFGHQIGDEVLRSVGRLLKGRMRETDFVARYGGEEFVMLMPGAAREDAWRVAEEIRQGMCGRPFNVGMKRVPVTISAGVSEFRNGDSPGAVFDRADEALYQAKQAGKNCCKAEFQR